MLVATAAVSDQLLGYLEHHVGLDAGFALALLRIIGINIVLSGDNAVVIALACRSLPRGQRLIGVILGAGAAALLRIVFTLGVQELLYVPWLKLAGGVTLLWVAVKLLLKDERKEDGIRSGANVFEALKIVAIADVVMSLDNVLAIAGAAAGDMRLIIIGLAISIPLVVFGSTALLWLLAHLPILVWVGAGLLGWVAGELIATEPILQPWVVALSVCLDTSTPALIKGVAACGAVFVVLIGWTAVKVRRLRDVPGAPAE